MVGLLPLPKSSMPSSSAMTLKKESTASIAQDESNPFRAELLPADEAPSRMKCLEGDPISPCVYASNNLICLMLLYITALGLGVGADSRGLSWDVSKSARIYK